MHLHCCASYVVLSKSDLEIAQSVRLQPIQKIATKLRIPTDELELYGKYKAKLPRKLMDDQKLKKSKLILVTAITPTPAGEGKTTTSIGLCEGLNKIGKKTTVVLQEPSLGKERRINKYEEPWI